MITKHPLFTINFYAHVKHLISHIFAPYAWTTTLLCTFSLVLIFIYLWQTCIYESTLIKTFIKSCVLRLCFHLKYLEVKTEINIDKIHVSCQYTRQLHFLPTILWIYRPKIKTNPLIQYIQSTNITVDKIVPTLSVPCANASCWLLVILIPYKVTLLIKGPRKKY